MQGQEKKLPGLGFKKLKKILKKCRSDLQCHDGIDGALDNHTCPDHCPGNLEKEKKKTFLHVFVHILIVFFGLFF
jgi:predicted nucleic acid-binding Zn ribbon protein